MITKSQQFTENSPSLSLTIGFSLKIDKKQPWRPSEILPTLLGCHQEFLLDDLECWRTFSHEDDFEVSGDLIFYFVNYLFPLYSISH